MTEARAAAERIALEYFDPSDDWFEQFTDEVELAIKTFATTAHASGRRDMREEAATVALEQRCERDTPWDLACTTIAASIRALPDAGGKP